MDYTIRQQGGGGGGGHRRRKRIPRRDPLGIRAVRERPTPTHGCPYLSPTSTLSPPMQAKRELRLTTAAFEYYYFTPGSLPPSPLLLLCVAFLRIWPADPEHAELSAVSGKQAPVSAAIPRCLRRRRRKEASKRNPRKRREEITRGKGSLMLGLTRQSRARRRLRR